MFSYQFVSGNRYEGQFIHGQQTGPCTFKYASGDVFTGYFQDGRRLGPGKLAYADGHVFEGEWILVGALAVDSSSTYLAHGLGKMTFCNGNRYEGEFRKGRMTGRGNVVTTDGSVHEGVGLMLGLFSN